MLAFSLMGVRAIRLHSLGAGLDIGVLRLFGRTGTHKLISNFFLVVDNASAISCAQLFYRSDHEYYSKCNRTH